jgi:hypothetical protein
MNLRRVANRQVARRLDQSIELRLELAPLPAGRPRLETADQQQAEQNDFQKPAHHGQTPPVGLKKRGCRPWIILSARLDECQTNFQTGFAPSPES